MSQISFTPRVPVSSVELVDGLLSGDSTLQPHPFLAVDPKALAAPAELPMTTLAAFAFATADPGPQELCKLVGDYGFLGEPALIAVSDQEGGWREMVAEPLARWQQTCSELRRAVLSWRMSFCSSWPQWDAYFFDEAAPPSRDASAAELADMTAGSWQLAATTVEPHLQRLRLALPSQGQAGGLALVPPDLETFLWLELASAMASSAQPVECVGCDAWFLVSARTARTDKKYCSDACRMKVYRLRKKQEATA